MKVNSSLPSATYMRWLTGSAWVQVMACCLSGAKPLPEPMLQNCQLDTWEQTLMKFESKYEIFFEENVFETIICEMTAILSGGEMS